MSSPSTRMSAPSAAEARPRSRRSGRTPCAGARRRPGSASCRSPRPRPGRGSGSRRSPPPPRRGTGRRPGARSIARRGPRAARRPPRRAPGRSCSSMSAPMRLQDVDDGTPRRVRADPVEAQLGVGVDRRRPPARTRRADGSAGTVSSTAATVDGPATPDRVPAVRRRRPRRTATPRARSIRSVWSRVATASVTHVSPSAARPASRIADLTWALGTGVS